MADPPDRVERATLEKLAGRWTHAGDFSSCVHAANVFYRSGWTQEDLAKAEGCARQHVARRLLFGGFLAFAPTGAFPESATSKLTEGRFRDYWSRTDPARCASICRRR